MEFIELTKFGPLKLYFSFKIEYELLLLTLLILDPNIIIFLAPTLLPFISELELSILDLLPLISVGKKFFLLS